MRLAVVSPFLDRRHGTERCIIEQLERISLRTNASVHVYSQRLEDIRGLTPFSAPLADAPGIFWHKIATVAGPHLIQYIFWFFANRSRRDRDAARGLVCDLTYSPGINATDADAIAVHIVFHELYHQVSNELQLFTNPLGAWPRLLHRRLYYRLIMALENRIYKNPKIALVAVSALVAQQLKRYFNRENVLVIRNCVDAEALSPSRRRALRATARQLFGIGNEQFTFLFIGNDWKTKGLEGLVRGLSAIKQMEWRLLVVGDDSRSEYEKIVRRYGVEERASLASSSPNVLQFYAASDAYISPSLQDAYGLPVLEAMACGLPVVASSRAGVTEIVSHGVNGIVLRDPEDAVEIADVLKSLLTDAELRRRLGEEGARTAQQETWERNAQATWEWLNEVLQRKTESIANRQRT